MEEIKIREYVRTKEGNIYKITSYDKETNKYHSLEGKFWFIIFPRDIVKHSPNIIDIIECGDYVNGMKVLEVCINSPSGSWLEVDCNKTSEDCTLWNDDIKDVVTKEQFNQMKYIVGE